MEISKIDYTQFKFPKGKINKEDKEKGLKTILKRNKPIKKISKNKKTVSKETYQKVYERDKGICQLCGSSQNLHLHHIMGRGKDLTDNPDNCIMLCRNCHLEVVHKNQKKYRPILLEKVRAKNV